MIDTETLLSLSKNHTLLKGYDVTPENVVDIPKEFNGIALLGSIEEKPGLQDYDELASIFEVLEIDE